MMVEIKPRIDDEIIDFFPEVQFYKKLMDDVSENDVRDFADKIDDILIFTYQALNNGRYTDELIVPSGAKWKGGTLLKARINASSRLFFLVEIADGVRQINLMKIWVNHDTQGDYIVNFDKPKDWPTGAVRWRTRNFLVRMEQFKAEGKFLAANFLAMFDDAQKYVCDADQEKVLKKIERVKNISLVGNAGSGKSIVGESWLKKRMQTENVLYLTMSQGLTNARRDVYVRQKRLAELEGKNDDTTSDQIEFTTIYDFLLNHASRYGFREQYKECRNVKESFQLFLEAMLRHNAFGIGKKTSSGRKSQVSQQKILWLLWRNIHGIIFGCIPGRARMDSQDFAAAVAQGDFSFLEKQLSFEEYDSKLNKERGTGLDCILDIGKAAEIYTKEKERRRIADPNDLARFILTKCPPLKSCGAVFLDECQDLTEMELLAIFHVVRHSGHRLLASDMCQMVQPTFFSPGVMQMLASAPTGSVEYAGDEVVLHHNYRSVEEIVAFQEAIIEEIHKHFTLKVEYIQGIQAVFCGEHKPLWITADAGNGEEIVKLWQKLDDIKLQAIVADTSSAGWQMELLHDYEGKRLVFDPVSCKGMEFRAVLMWNILSELLKNGEEHAEWAWRYFYVAATRAQARLVIYEEDSDEYGSIGRFLERMAEQGIVEKVPFFTFDERKTTNNTIFSELNQVSNDEYSKRALEYRNSGRYAEAIELYQQLGSAYQADVDLCMAYQYEVMHEYSAALQIFMKMENNFVYISDMLNQAAIDAKTYFVGLLYISEKQYDKPEVLYRQYEKRFGQVDFDKLTDEVCAEYPAVQEKLQQYEKNLLEMLGICGQYVDEEIARATWN